MAYIQAVNHNRGAVEMNTTINFLDAIKAKHGLTSDYALAKFLGESHTRISNYRVQRSFLDDLMAVKVAEALEIDPFYVIASANAERSKKDSERKVWTDILEKLGGLAASVVIGLALSALPSHDAFAGSSGANSVYYVKSCSFLFRLAQLPAVSISPWSPAF